MLIVILVSLHYAYKTSSWGSALTIISNISAGSRANIVVFFLRGVCKMVFRPIFLKEYIP